MGYPVWLQWDRICLASQRPDVPGLGDTQGGPHPLREEKGIRERIVGGGDWDGVVSRR